MSASPNVHRLVYSVRQWEGGYFSRDMPGGVETPLVHSSLWTMAGDGSDRRSLPNPGPRAEHPVVSQDGHWIYWQCEVAGRWQIHRMRPDGSSAMQIAPRLTEDDGSASAFGVALAAGGRFLTYTLHDGITGRVVRARSDGTDAHFLAPNFGYTYMAAPDATAEGVVFSGPARDYRLVLMDATKTTPQVLTPNHPDCYVPQFTPDGSAIIFIRRDGGLYRVSPEGTNLRQLADGVQVEFFLSPEDTHGSTDVPAISPDGNGIAFIQRSPAGPPQLTRVNGDGGTWLRLTALPGVCARPAWSPDGRWLAFVSMVGRRSQVFVVPADGSLPPRKLTDENGSVYALCWLRKTCESSV